MKRGAILIALLLALGAGWYFGSPWWTLWRMRQAAEAGDAAALSAYVDYPALRASAKRQLRMRFGASRGDIELGALAALVGAGIADRAVDAAVSPGAMRLVFVAAPAAALVPAPLRMRASDMAMRRDGPGQFRLVAKDGSGGELVFRLRGAGWKLVDVRVPGGI